MEHKTYFLPSDSDDEDKGDQRHARAAPTHGIQTSATRGHAQSSNLYFVDDDDDPFNNPFATDAPILRSSSRSTSRSVVRSRSSPERAQAPQNDSHTPSVGTESDGSAGSGTGSGALQPLSASLDDLASDPYPTVSLRRASATAVAPPLQTPSPHLKREPAARAPLPLSCYAAQSPHVQAPPRPPPATLPIEYLRRLTVLEVRDPLERFFAEKDRWCHAFRLVERRLLPELAGEDPAPAPAADRTPALWRERDRCARLVNTGNWPADAAADVLLPASLVPCSSAFAHVPPGGGGGAALSLRPHQVAGIRFLWDLLVESPVGKVPAVGCILAHTMGLGKTAQVVLFLNLFLRTFTPLAAPTAAHFFAPREAAPEGPGRGPAATAAARADRHPQVDPLDLAARGGAVVAALPPGGAGRRRRWLPAALH
ncbi:hypothetical protein STCU_11583 [Strigomonas culicis]|uniref:SNF2 N-terminal domain-containing protein n=1 Tax=Strigomonas culicis TaxID=28005 RepID=S9UZU8_9TRYP|nr:hypothetical protein STCU_11583 [Strigomonas culicis]|eukprot:EPY16045.1 hypothetical protein STCU_11583 [Strigomonas culicis]